MTLYQVTQTTDNGNGDTVGTLSYAILQANRNAGTDAINMQFFLWGGHLVRP
ncbi:MAG: hypothetical protein V7L02_14640 [Nostoc sp.]|uniref:hypothetical protein n=1 Tax=Nostoc sp. TaxID=1180 RepID=UPI002FF7E60E